MNFRDPQVQKKAMLVMLPLALAVVYQQLVYAPRATRIDELEIRLETLEAQNNTLRAVVARYGGDLERRLAIFQEHLGQMEQLIPSREDVPHLVNQITESAGSSGVEIVEIRPGGETPGDHYSKQTYELRVVGDYHSVAEYLTTIGSLPRIVRSADVNILRAENSPSDGPALLQVRFRIDTYVMPAPGESPPAPVEG